MRGRGGGNIARLSIKRVWETERMTRVKPLNNFVKRLFIKEERRGGR